MRGRYAHTGTRARACPCARRTACEAAAPLVPTSRRASLLAACTFDGHLLTAYRNGKRADFVTIDIPCEELTIHANADLYVGAYPGRYAWDGLVDVVRLWGRCIEWADVRTAMNNSHVTNDPQLLGQWTCSEGA
eukprot:6317787-Prymnesium_polylepis.2